MGITLKLLGLSRVKTRQPTFMVSSTLLLKLGGMGALVATLPLLLCDWLNLLLDYPLAPVAWGIVHLLIDAWYWAFIVTGFRRLPGLPLGLSLALIGLGCGYSLPLAMLFIRG